MFFPTYKLNCQDKRKKLSNDINLSEEKFSAVEIFTGYRFSYFSIIFYQGKKSGKTDLKTVFSKLYEIGKKNI